MLDPQASGYDEAPRLWWDQYDRNIQILRIPQAGKADRHCACDDRRGDPALPECRDGRFNSAGGLQ